MFHTCKLQPQMKFSLKQQITSWLHICSRQNSCSKIKAENTSTLCWFSNQYIVDLVPKKKLTNLQQVYLATEDFVQSVEESAGWLVFTPFVY